MTRRAIPTLLCATLLGGCAAQGTEAVSAQAEGLIEVQVAWRGADQALMGALAAQGTEAAEAQAIVAALRAAGLTPLTADAQGLRDWGLAIARRQQDAEGNVHLRLDLSRAGARIEGMGLNISLRGGAPYALVGTYTAQPLASTGALSVERARGAALTVARLSEGELSQAPIVTPIIVATPAGLTLTHRVDLRTDLSEPRIYVRAADGAILAHYDRAHHGDTTGAGPLLDTDELKGQTQSFGVYFDGSQYYQRDNSRGDATIRTFDVDQCGTGTSLCGGEAKSADNAWPKAHNNSAHALTGQILDFWSERYGINGFDDRGTPLRVFQMQSSEYDNAYWNGIDSIVVGDGSYSTGNGYYDYLSRADIMGHELGHAVEGALGPDLLYRQESGALAEAIGDMAGVYFERWLESEGDMSAAAGDWLIGEDAVHPDSRHPYAAMRDMSAPKRMLDADTWRGAYWLPTEGCEPAPGNDNCGVHSNSGVANYAFYLLSEGGEGVNDHGYAFAVSPIGMEAAHAIVFQAFRYHMHEGTGFQGYYDAMVLSAAELFGAGSAEVAQVEESLRAVGLRIVGNGACELGEDETSAPSDCGEGEVPTPEPTPTEPGEEVVDGHSYVDGVGMMEARATRLSFDITSRVVIASDEDGEPLSGAWVTLRVEDSEGYSAVFEGTTGHDGAFSVIRYKVRRGVTVTACVESVNHPTHPWAADLDLARCASERAGL